MAAKLKTTWIAVLDAAQARFFTLRKTDDGQIFEEAAMALNAGHTRDTGNGKSGRSDVERHAFEPRANPRKLEKRNFTMEVAEALDAALADRRYTELVLVAPPRSLGELREILPERVLKTLMLEVPKSLTNLAPDALWSKLSIHLLQGAKTLNGATERVTEKAKGTSVPLSVLFRNMTATPSVHADAVRQADKLGRKFGRIVSCRVIVDASHHPHRKVKMFRVSVDLKLPGRDIAARSANDRSQEDVKAALRDAFAAAERQMQDFRGRKGNPAQSRRTISFRAFEEVD